MSRFKRQTEVPEEVVIKDPVIKKKKAPRTKHPTGFDSMRVGKDKIILPVTDMENYTCNVSVAQQMLKAFQWRPWMEDFIDKNGNEITTRRRSI